MFTEKSSKIAGSFYIPPKAYCYFPTFLTSFFSMKCTKRATVTWLYHTKRKKPSKVYVNAYNEWISIFFNQKHLALFCFPQAFGNTLIFCDWWSLLTHQQQLKSIDDIRVHSQCINGLTSPWEDNSVQKNFSSWKKNPLTKTLTITDLFTGLRKYFQIFLVF